MPIPKTEKIWHDGKFIHWDDARIHVLSHVVSYGSASAVTIPSKVRPSSD
jgi:branched-subunit amino acid aminotransferase/4-amino-4-deoxychorismate lyase